MLRLSKRGVVGKTEQLHIHRLFETIDVLYLVPVAVARKARRVSTVRGMTRPGASRRYSMMARSSEIVAMCRLVTSQIIR